MSILPCSIISSSSRGIFLDVGLAALDRQALLHQLAERELVGEAAIDAGDRDPAALAAGEDRLAQRMRPLGAEIDLRLHRVGDIVDGEAVAFHADAIDHRVRADAAGHLVERLADVDLVIVEDLGAELLRQLQPVREMVDRDHPVRRP